MYLERTVVDIALRINVLMVVFASDPAVNDFHAAEFDHPVSLVRFEAGGLGIENNLPHSASIP
jgi:hypothetical protein